MASCSPPTPPPVDAALRARIDFQNDLRLWTLGVRFATRDLLALGRPYDVQLSLRAHPTPLGELAPLGFELLPLYGSHVMSVKNTTLVDTARVSARLVSLQGAPAAADVAPLDAIRAEDFLVRFQGDDLLLAPSHGLAPLRKRILAACNATTTRGSGVVTLRFVRMDRLIQVDPTRNVTHGSVLVALDALKKTHERLKASYERLLARNRATVTHRLARHKKLLGYGEYLALTMADAARQDEKYQFAAKFQMWYASMVAADDYEGDGDATDNESDAGVELTEFAMDGDVDDTNQADETDPDPIFLFDPSQQLQPVQPRPADIDLQWRDVLLAREMKWLPLAHVVLTKFIEGLVEGFSSDGFWISEMASRSRSIAERLVMMYARKLQTSTSDNVTVRKEFVQHARMLRSNIGNPGNKQLRRDVLSGAISPATLCEMSSEQLAPEALQADRQRRYDQHTKEITLTASEGPVLLKTKHGFKEGYLQNGPTVSSLDGSGFGTSPTVEVEATRDPTLGVSSLQLRQPSDEAAERLDAMRVDLTASTQVATAGAEARSQVTTQTHRALDGPAPPAEAAHAQRKPLVDAVTLVNANATSEEARAFLTMMFDPAYDLEGTIRQLQSTIHSTPLATMSTEFMLAPGVQLYRDILTAHTQRGNLQYRARVRLLNWKFQQDSSNDSDATMSALYQLLKELEECRRLFGRLLEELRLKCGFPQPATNRDAHRHAIDILVRAGMKVNHQPSSHRNNGAVVEMYRADALIDGISIVTRYDGDAIAARNSAAHDVAAFLSDLVAIKHAEVHRSQAAYHTDLYGNLHHQYSEHPPETHYHDDGNHIDLQLHSDDRYVSTDSNRVDTSMDRKRPLTDSYGDSAVTEPASVRRKLEAPADQTVVTPSPEASALFYADSKGETRQPAPDLIAQEEKEKIQVDTYQELVRFLFRSPADVLAGVQFDWNADIPEKEVELSNRLTITRTISRRSDGFVCQVTGLGGNLLIKSSTRPLEEAAAHVTRLLSLWLDGLYGDWSNMVETYNRIMERKRRQRVPQADASLSAAFETRKDRAVSNITVEEETDRRSMSEYLIKVRSLVVVRQVCMNKKMAKRAAGESFKALLDYINKANQDRERNAGLAPTATAGASVVPSAGAPTIPTPTTVVPAARNTPVPTIPARAPPKSNMVVCSDDSDEGDDDDYYDGGGYSEDDDWHPQVTASEAQGTVHTGEKNTRDRVTTILSQPYPIESESGIGDDAKFRAVIRSLFTPEDDLCAGISQIRGALKYRGHHNAKIVPNVQASIQLELVRGEVFNVYASVNDVIRHRGTARSKPEACDQAVDGLLRELERTRQVWVELMHFYHMKELGNHDPLDSFYKLRLANITRIETKTESAPHVNGRNRTVEAKMASGVHCVMYFGNKVVYRVDDETEDEAHKTAMCRTLMFLIDLIDKGLDPTPTGVQDEQFAPMQIVDWACKVTLEDLGDRFKRAEFSADGRWAIQGRNPTARGLTWPTNVTLNQIGRVPMHSFEQSFRSSSDPNIFFFRIEATYENGKFVNYVADYGHKNKCRAFVLHLEVVENRDIDVFIFPPAASVNSQNNLYWSRKIMPSELSDLKAVYGYAVRRQRSSR